MARKKVTEEKKEDSALDERFSLESYDGILGSLGLVADAVFSGSLDSRKADLLVKVLGAARMTITEKRKAGAMKNEAVESNPMNSASEKITSAGPFGVYSFSGKK